MTFERDAQLLPKIQAAIETGGGANIIQYSSPPAIFANALVDVKDIVEELVGDIVDEYDVEESQVIANGQGYLVDGKVNIYDLNSEIGSHFESDVFDTVGGYVFGLFGRQPQKGEEMESEGYRFTIDETDGRRIMRLHITPLEESFDDSGQVLSL